MSNQYLRSAIANTNRLRSEEEAEQKAIETASKGQAHYIPTAQAAQILGVSEDQLGPGPYRIKDGTIHYDKSLLKEPNVTYKYTEGENELFRNQEMQFADGRPSKFSQILTEKGEYVESTAENKLPKLFEHTMQDGKPVYTLDSPAMAKVRTLALNQISPSGDLSFLADISNEKNNPYRAAKEGTGFDLHSGNVKAMIPIMDQVIYEDGKLVFNPSHRQKREALRGFQQISNIIKGGQKITTDKNVAKRILSNKDTFKGFPDTDAGNLAKQEARKMLGSFKDTSIPKYKLIQDDEGFKFVLNDTNEFVKKYLKYDPATEGELKYLNQSIKLHRRTIQENDPALYNQARSDAKVVGTDTGLEIFQGLGAEYNAIQQGYNTDE
tara:strand:- start:11567 stop:12709 length:1143 start_codon:yes stop_codon:yes gene_type:complete